MKKILALTLIMVLAMAGMASAAVTVGGSLKVEYVIDTDGADAGKGYPDAPLKVNVSAEDEGVWDLSVDLKADIEDIKEGDKVVKVGDWTFNLNDEWFSVELWGGGVEKDYLSTPLEFVGTDDPAVADTARMRLSSDLGGLLNVTVDYEPVREGSNLLYVFASKAIDDVTVGGAIRKDLNIDGMKAAGYVKYVFGPATLTGEVGVDTTEGRDKDNLSLGGKVDYKLTDKLTVGGKITHKGEKIDQDKPLVIEPSVTYTEDLFKVTGKFTRTEFTAKDAAGEATNKLTASVTYRSNQDVAFDDLFDSYDELTGYAAFAEVAYTTPRDIADDKEPATSLTIKGAGAAVPEMVWLYGDVIYKADKDITAEDEDFEFIAGTNTLTDGVVLRAKDYTRFSAEATVKVTDKLSVVPSVKYGTWTEAEVPKDKDGDMADDKLLENLTGMKNVDVTELELSAALTYALSDAAEVGLSYTNRTQKFEKADEEQELNDSFIKVYFSTSF
ncbi:MAG TPA: hypothetical protein GXX47_08050 [Firmicutes bacterium]|nr:hypothetical protein [Bacillota bacterium]